MLPTLKEVSSCVASVENTAMGSPLLVAPLPRYTSKWLPVAAKISKEAFFI